MADLGTAFLVASPPLGPLVSNLVVSMVVPKSLEELAALEPPFTGIPITGQIWPRSRTTVVEEGMNRESFTISTDTTMASEARTDYVYVCTATLTATLPTAVSNTNIYTIKNVGTGTVTVATTGGQTIDGASTFPIDIQWMSMDFASNGSNWMAI